jgi:hypothetical protein
MSASVSVNPNKMSMKVTPLLGPSASLGSTIPGLCGIRVPTPKNLAGCNTGGRVASYWQQSLT